MKDKASSTTGYSQPPCEKEGKLTREEVSCPICWSILVRPVTLPCNHSLCLLCFERTVEEAYLQCPCCRVRTSVWSRRAAKADSLVNEKFWERIQEEFPRLVEARENGEDSQLINEDDIDEASRDLFGLDESRSMNFGQSDATGPSFIKDSDDEDHAVPDSTSDIASSCRNGSQGLNSTVKCIRQFKTEDGFGTQKFFSGPDDMPSICDSSIDMWYPANADPFGNFGLEDAENNHRLVRKSMEASTTTGQALFDLSGFDPRDSRKRLLNNHRFASTSKPKRTNVTATVTSSVHSMSQGSGANSSFVAVLSPKKNFQQNQLVAKPGRVVVISDVDHKKGVKEITTLPCLSPMTSDTPDSINVEVNTHFRPIRSAPKTPPKRRPDGSFLPEPRIVKTKPIRLDSASGIEMLASLSEDREKLKNDPKRKGQKRSARNKARASNLTASRNTPSPPRLIHFASQQIISPEKFVHENGRAGTAPPPELLHCDEETSDRYMRSRQLSEIKYRQAQAAKLEEFRIKKLQEEKDRALAEKLQKKMDKTTRSEVVRSRGAQEGYEIRNWVDPTAGTSQASTSQPPSARRTLRSKRPAAQTETHSKKLTSRQNVTKVARTSAPVITTTTTRKSSTRANMSTAAAESQPLRRSTRSLRSKR